MQIQTGGVDLLQNKTSISIFHTGPVATQAQPDLITEAPENNFH